MRALALCGLFLLCAGARPLAAQTAGVCEFQITCPLPDREATLTFESRSHDCLEDDVTVTLDTKPEPTRLDLPPAWYYDVSNTGNRRTVCRSTTYPEYPAFPLAGNRLLLFLRRNGRPGLDVLSAAVVDLATGRILDSATLGETLRSSLGVLGTKAGFQLPVVRDVLESVRCDCDAALVEGWLEIEVGKDGRLKKGWTKDGRPGP